MASRSTPSTLDLSYLGVTARLAGLNDLLAQALEQAELEQP
jgi:hypothetical protein